jgi:hypothetical protein
MDTLLSNQKFNDNDLKGFLLKNLDKNTTNPSIQLLNKFLISRVNTFWEYVVLPLKKLDKFDGNKINWYFEIYKEGLQAKKLNNLSQQYINLFDISHEQIIQLINFYKNKDIFEYIDLGTSFLTNTYTLLNAWSRDQLLQLRLKHIYFSDLPFEWILYAQQEEKGIMIEKPKIDGLTDILNNINLIISKRV